MSSTLRISTLLALPLPFVLLVAAETAPPGVAVALFPATAFALLVYAVIWFWARPSRFELDHGGLSIVWPLRSRRVPLDAIDSVELLPNSSFRGQYGLGVRVGAGGLWGGFGLLKTSRDTFSMWISTFEDVVVVRLKHGVHPLLISPERPESFVAALRTLKAR